MKIWPKKYGSPFDVGVKENVKLYSRCPKGSYLKWQMPHALPPLEDWNRLKGGANCVESCAKRWILKKR